MSSGSFADVPESKCLQRKHNDENSERPAIIDENVRRIVLQEPEKVLDAKISTDPGSDEAYRKKDEI